MRIEYQDPKKKNWFLITWDLSNKCNYRCSYCPPFFHNGSLGWPMWDDVKQFIININEQFPEREICFRISGGEPTHWKDFLKFSKFVKSKGNYFSFLSNGSKDITYFKSIAENVDGLILSYHPEFSNINHFIDISKILKCPIAVNLMMIPERFNEMFEIGKKLFDESSMSIWPKIVLDKSGNMDQITNEIKGYSKEQLDIINDWKFFRKLDESKIHRGGLLLDNELITANQLLSKNLNQYSGWTCWAGIDMINIDFKGNIYRANCEQGGSLGSIRDFKIPKEPIICRKDTCNCLSDLYLRKELVLK